MLTESINGTISDEDMAALEDLALDVAMTDSTGGEETMYEPPAVSAEAEAVEPVVSGPAAAFRGNTMSSTDPAFNFIPAIEAFDETKVGRSIIPTMLTMINGALKGKLMFNASLGWVLYDVNTGIWDMISDEKMQVIIASFFKPALEEVKQRAVEKINDEAKKREVLESLEGKLPSYLSVNMTSNLVHRIKTAWTTNNVDLEEVSKYSGSYCDDEGNVGVNFNGNPFLFPVVNGVLDLSPDNIGGSCVLGGNFARLRANDPRNMLMKYSRVVFDPKAEAPLFLKYLNDIAMNDRNKMKLILQMMGYALTGDRKFHANFVLYGPSGNNGKSVLTDIIKALAGEGDNGFSTGVDISMLDDKFNIIKTLGKRVNITGEVSTDISRRAVAVWKAMTAGESVYGGYKYRRDFVFKSSCTSIVSCNNFPKFAEFDEGTSRRMHIIQFNKKYMLACDKDYRPNDPFIGLEDRTLIGKLLKELPGILNLALQGLYSLYLDNKFVTLEESIEVKTEVKRDHQPLAEFLDWMLETYFLAGSPTIKLGVPIVKEFFYDTYLHKMESQQLNKLDIRLFWRYFKSAVISHEDGYRYEERRQYINNIKKRVITIYKQ